MNDLVPNLAWEIEVNNIYSNDVQIPNYQAIQRSDNGNILHVVKKSYMPMNNAKFAEILGELQKISGYKHAGFAEFDGGKKVMGYLRGAKSTIGKFPVDNYLVLGNAHDGTQTTYIGSVMIISRQRNGFTEITPLKISHTINSDTFLSTYTENFSDFLKIEAKNNTIFNEMNDIKISKDDIEVLTKKLLDIDPKAKDHLISTRKKNIFLNINELINKELKKTGSSLFGWLNGIFYYTSHVRSAKDKVFGNVTGSMFDVNKKAYNVSTDMATKLK